MFRLTLILVTLCLMCSTTFSEEVVLSWTHGVRDPTYSNTMQRSPATVLTHTGGSGQFTQGLHIPLTFIPRQDLYVNGEKWVLEWCNGMGGSWFWTKPSRVGYPFSLSGSWVYPQGSNVPTYTYVIEPAGERFQAPTIYANRLGQTQAVWWSHRYAPVLGGTSVSQVYTSAPGVYGSCSVSPQHLGATGSLYGFSSLPSFFGWTWDQWETGLIIIGRSPTLMAPTIIADFTASGSVTIQDLFSFLESWLSDDAAADIDRSGQCSEEDLFLFIDCWFRA